MPVVNNLFRLLLFNLLLKVN